MLSVEYNPDILASFHILVMFVTCVSAIHQSTPPPIHPSTPCTNVLSVLCGVVSSLLYVEWCPASNVWSNDWLDWLMMTTADLVVIQPIVMHIIQAWGRSYCYANILTGWGIEDVLHILTVQEVFTKWEIWAAMQPSSLLLSRKLNIMDRQTTSI